MVLDPKNNWIQVDLSFDKKEEEVEKSIIALPDDYKPAQKPFKAVSVATDPEGQYQHGDVIVVANSDEWLMRKKGFVFMPFEERRDILKEIKGVIIVAAVDDSDGTVCDALRKIRPDFFANGGDRGKENTPEQDVCEELEIRMLWGIGGDYKRNSSSDLAKNLVENYPKENK